MGKRYTFDVMNPFDMVSGDLDGFLYKARCKEFVKEKIDSGEYLLLPHPVSKDEIISYSDERKQTLLVHGKNNYLSLKPYNKLFNKLHIQLEPFKDREELFKPEDDRYVFLQSVFNDLPHEELCKLGYYYYNGLIGNLYSERPIYIPPDMLSTKYTDDQTRFCFNVSKNQLKNLSIEKQLELILVSLSDYLYKKYTPNNYYDIFCTHKMKLYKKEEILERIKKITTDIQEKNKTQEQDPVDDSVVDYYNANGISIDTVANIDDDKLTQHSNEHHIGKVMNMNKLAEIEKNYNVRFTFCDDSTNKPTKVILTSKMFPQTDVFISVMSDLKRNNIPFIIMNLQEEQKQKPQKEVQKDVPPNSKVAEAVKKVVEGMDSV